MCFDIWLFILFSAWVVVQQGRSSLGAPALPQEQLARPNRVSWPLNSTSFSLFGSDAGSADAPESLPIIVCGSHGLLKLRSFSPHSNRPTGAQSENDGLISSLGSGGNTSQAIALPWEQGTCQHRLFRTAKPQLQIHVLFWKCSKDTAHQSTTSITGFPTHNVSKKAPKCRKTSL